jgi:hypothetical protein
MVGQLRCAEREDPLGLLLTGAVCWPKVRVHPVLHRLAVRDGDEKQELAPIPRHDQALLVPSLVRIVGILDEVQHLGPEGRLCVGIPGVERRMRYAAGHDGSLEHEGEAVKQFPWLRPASQDETIASMPEEAALIAAYQSHRPVLP